MLGVSTEREDTNMLQGGDAAALAMLESSASRHARSIDSTSIRVEATVVRTRMPDCRRSRHRAGPHRQLRAPTDELCARQVCDPTSERLRRRRQDGARLVTCVGTASLADHTRSVCQPVRYAAPARRPQRRTATPAGDALHIRSIAHLSVYHPF
ncbi:hypothetical protein FA09DRAFT_53075 [Tilletiopsis washingtonensis]|uniref:Uncharacterized protein n=1 Tax=Tilletiopsis washingtonensis TaxID=58919 RepID=A0A316Z6J3_9BASI|nr:hypothetical protein FA09DRAFT_53075 [Tilletiopsis washingtonensis]PWN97407.1 hypothetical protein FA09DRAFT_53075 [Tilletiopsis washingtonensis]